MAAHEARDHKRALALWLPLDEAGHAEAQYRVGRLHEEGEGIAKDEAVAADFQEGLAPDQFLLAQT